MLCDYCSLLCKTIKIEYTEPVPTVIWVMYSVCIGFVLLLYYMCEQQWIWNRQCASEQVVNDSLRFHPVWGWELFYFNINQRVEYKWRESCIWRRENVDLKSVV